jgi:DNA-binding MarR family transcriptional regulator
MSSISSADTDDPRHRRRLTTSVKDSVRALSIQLTLLNHQVSTHLELKDVDLDCLDLIGRFGPLSPTALARHAGLHPATVTGVLDRLERGGWAVRERDTTDRRAVLVSALPDRAGEVFGLYSGMATSMDQICAGYTDEQLELLAGFLRDVTEAGQTATDRLAES